MASPISKSRTHRMKRSKNPMINQPEKSTPVLITEAEVDTTVLSLTFNSPVSLTRNTVPQITTDVAGAAPQSVEQTSPNSVDVTFDASIAAATSLNIPNRDPAIRNSSGGFVTSNTFRLAA